MYNILHECSATVRKSLEGLDYFVAEGGRAFTDITNLVDVTTHGLLSETLRKQYQSLLLNSKRYVKTDLKVKTQWYMY